MFGSITSAWSSVQASSSRIVSRIPAVSRAASTSATPAPRAGAHLGDLAPAKGSKHAHQRYGRGVGSTKGGTAGRGHKGQKARSGTGKPVPGYEGGQTPLHRLIPKRGFVNFTSRVYAPLALSKIQSLISTSRISPSEPITIGSLVRNNAVHGLSNSYAGIKILGPADPTLPLPPIRIEASRFSKSAAEAVIAAGGSVSAVYKNRLALQAEIHPWKAPAGMMREAEPIGKRDIEYYSDPKKHGYLAQRKAAMEDAEAV